ncbi:MAG TPA: tyrosine-type recombinase/integrase [Phycisphaerae bacterium]|nr:tyrosine-type recombinase/integrase [Phycisphaerae bacterium]HOI54892.1 tyrosine-type recombinase/integrase [Phycisphaerae bacterium]
MATTRALEMDEARRMQETFGGRWALRNRCLVELGVRCGFRISEMLSLRVADVLEAPDEDGTCRVRDRLTVVRSNTKGKVATRSVVLHPKAAEALALWVADLQGQGYWRGETWLFQSAWGADRNTRITRVQAWRIVREAARRIHSRGCVGTHSMRKAAVTRFYEQCGRDLLRTQKFSGHKDLDSLRAYIAVDQEEVDGIVLSMD